MVSQKRVALGIFFTLTVLLMVWFVMGAINGATVTLVAPANNYTNASGNLLVNVTFTNSANVSVHLQNATAWKTLNISYNQTSPFQYYLDTTNFTDFQYYNLSVNVTNSTNLTGDMSYRYNLTFDNTKPVMIMYNASSVNTTDSNPTFFFNYTDNLGSNGNCTLYMNSVSKGTNTGVVSGTNTSITASAVVNGTYFVNVTCNDPSGNTNSTANITVIVDTVAPTIAAFTLNDSSPTKAGNITLHLQFTEAHSNLDYATSPTVKFEMPNGTQYTLTELTYSALNWSGYYDMGGETDDGTVIINVTGAKDVVGNVMTKNATNTFTFDSTAPTVSQVWSTNASGYYNAGDVLNLSVNFTEAVTVLGGARLALELGGTDRNATYASGNGTTVLSFTYTVQAGDTSSDLNATGTTALTTNGSIRDAASNDATLTLPVGAGDLATNEALVIDTTAPTITNMTPGNNTRHGGLVSVNVSVVDELAGTNDSLVKIYNGTAWATMTRYEGDAFNGNYTDTIDTSVLTDGAFNIVVNVTDNATNNNSITWTFIVDNTEPSVVIASPAATAYNNTMAMIVVLNVTDSLASTMYCNLSATNGTLQYMNVNASVENASQTILNFTSTSVAPGNWSWNVTCHDYATLMGSGTVGNTNTTANRNYLVDVAPIVISDISLNESDVFVSNNVANNQITVLVTAADVGVAGIKNITVDFSNLTGNGLGVVNTTPLGGGVYNATVTVTNVSAFDFEPLNITVQAYDNALNGFAGQGYTTVILYNATVPDQSSNGCYDFGPLTTNLSAETDFNDVNMLLEVQLNGTATCSPSGQQLPWGETFRSVLFLNFSTVNLSDETVADKFDQMYSAIEVNLTPLGDFGDSRIYVNTSFFAALNTNTTMTFYDLPFTSLPAISKDNSSQNTSSISWVQNAFNASFNVSTGNLTFTVTGFSGYNMTDNTTPTATVHYPTSALNTSDNTTLINVTLNGTDTEISQALFYVNGALVGYYNDSGNTASCTNTTPGGENYTCLFNTSALNEGHKVLNLTFYDYGGVAPGNMGTTTINFLVDVTPPSIHINGPDNNSVVTGSLFHNFTASDFYSATGMRCYVNTTWNGWDNVGASDCFFNVGSVNNNSPTTCNPLGRPDAVYQWKVLCYDGANNSYATSIYNFTLDTTPPNVTLTSPTEATNTSDNTPELLFNASDALDETLNYTIFVNGVVNVTGVATNSTLTSVNLSTLSDGDYNVTVQVMDHGNWTANSSTVNFTIDTTAPTVTIQTTTAYTNDSTPSIIFKYVDSLSPTANCTVYFNSTATETNASVTNNTNTTLTRTTALLNATYNITVNCTDAASNTGNSSVLSLTVDTVPPVISAVSSGDPGSTSATITWTTDEAANATLHYGTTTAVTSTSTSATYGTSQSIALTGLSASTTYYYNVSSCDQAGNCNNSATTGAPAQGSFTTDAANTGSSGGGGGGYTATGLASGPEYASTVQLSTYGRYSFQGPEKKVHYVAVKELGADYAVFRFTSDPVDIKLLLDESGTVDITGDGVDDVWVKLVQLTSYSAVFQLSKPGGQATTTELGESESEVVSDLTGEETTTEEVEENVTGNVVTKPEVDTTPETTDASTDATSGATSKTGVWPWLLLLAGVIVVVVLFLAIKGKKSPPSYA